MKQFLMSAGILLSSTVLLTVVAAKEMVSSEGESFSVRPVAGDGNCAFNAIGKTREEVLTVLQGVAVEFFERHQQTSLTLSNAIASVSSLSLSSTSELKTDIAAQVLRAVAEVNVSEGRDVAMILTTLSKLNGSTLVSEEEFNAAKLLMQRHLQELMAFNQYSAFLIAMMEELRESGVKHVDLSTQDGIVSALATVFAQNQGRASWLPMGLIMGVTDRLAMNISVWSSRGEKGSEVTLLQASSVDERLPRVHVVWNGVHFDALQPK